jgi:hypothetical protein
MKSAHILREAKKADQKFLWRTQEAESFLRNVRRRTAISTGFISSDPRRDYTGSLPGIQKKAVAGKRISVMPISIR